MCKNEHLNFDLINGYLETLDVAMLKQMLELYTQQSQQYLTDISAAIIKEDQTLWQTQCHKMKGSAASVGLPLVHKKLVAIERSSENWAIKTEQVKKLTLLNQQAINAFNQWLFTQLT